MVLRGWPSQREVTRCGCHGSARVAPLFPELQDACGGLHYEEGRIVRVRQRQVKRCVTYYSIFCCDAAQDEDCWLLVIVTSSTAALDKGNSMRHMILTGTLMLALSTTAMASQIYKWVDEQGVTHFGAQPPQGQQATTINTSAPPPRPASSEPAPTVEEQLDPEQAAIDKKVKEDVAKQEAERKQYCENARTNLAQLENNPRLRIEDAGEVRRIDENERQERITELKKSIAENCK